MTDDQRYTLDQAQRILAERECQRYGHDWTVITTHTYTDPAGTPTAVICDRCHHSHTVLTASTPPKCPDNDSPRCELHCPNA